MSRPTKPVGSRSIEKLVALLHYEMTTSEGCGEIETADSFIAAASSVVMDPRADDDIDYTDEEIDEVSSACVVFVEYVLRGMIAAGRFADAERIIEGLATSRRECTAKFKALSPIPLTEDERTTLAASWGTHAEHEAA